MFLAGIHVHGARGSEHRATRREAAGYALSISIPEIGHTGDVAPFCA
jgi:hypothetical protein